ncbi:hypothetical protein F5B21DRAFT_469106 [Xylaria acuta]|nr:hypothetical protein F5B21DRAFT_469106 [Xylaria acuta]
MADQTEKNHEPKRKPDILQGPRLNYDIPTLISLPRLSTSQLTASHAVGVLLCYAAYLKYFSGIRALTAPGSNFTFPPITSTAHASGKPVDQDLDVESGVESDVFVELYLAILVLVLYLWPIWQAYKERTTFSRLVLSCLSNWIIAVTIFLWYLKLTQQYGLS